jgi:hypothetical protein
MMVENKERQAQRPRRREQGKEMSRETERAEVEIRKQGESDLGVSNPDKEMGSTAQKEK